MPAPLFPLNDYVRAIQALMPRGLVWPRDPSASQTAVIQGLAPIYYRINQDANALLVDAFPATTDHLLPEWNETLGLPGLLGYTGSDLATQQAQVVAALTDSGGQSPAYFIGLAAQLGYTITINGFRPTRVTDPVTWPIYGAAWANVWRVTAAIGADYSILRAIFTKYAPAHTTIFWDVPAGALHTEDGFILTTEDGAPIAVEH